MPTKKERIVELERKVAELEDKTKRNIFIPYIQPEQPPISIMSNWSICFNCGTRFQGNHVCWCVPVTRTWPVIGPSNGTANCFSCGQGYFPGVGHICPNAFKVTWTASTGSGKEQI
jgi:hypothetical protein